MQRDSDEGARVGRTNGRRREMRHEETLTVLLRGDTEREKGLTGPRERAQKGWRAELQKYGCDMARIYGAEGSAFFNSGNVCV